MGRALNTAKLIVGACAMAASNALLAWHVHSETVWALRDIVVAPPEPSAANDGKWVFVVGELDSDEPIDDPDYILPGRFVALQRVVERPHADDEGLTWEQVDKLGSIASLWRVPAHVRVGGYAFSTERAEFVDLPHARITEDAVRVDSAAPGVARAKWDPGRGFFVMRSDTAPGPSVTLGASGGSPEIGGVTGAVSFRGYSPKARVGVLGRQEGGRIVPGVLRPTDRARVLVSPKLTLGQAVADEESRHVSSAIALGAVAALAFLCVFVHPLAVLFGVLSCGMMYLFESESLRDFVTRILLVVVAVAAPAVAAGLATAHSSVTIALGWTLLASALAVWLRARKGLGEDLESESSPLF